MGNGYTYFNFLFIFNFYLMQNSPDFATVAAKPYSQPRPSYAASTNAELSRATDFQKAVPADSRQRRLQPAGVERNFDPTEVQIMK